MTICTRVQIVKPRAKLLHSSIITSRFLNMRVTFKKIVFSEIMVSANETKSYEVLAKYDVLSPTRLKKPLKRLHFSSAEDVIAAAETWLDGQPEFFLEGLAKVRVWSLWLVSFLVGLRTYQQPDFKFWARFVFWC